MRLLKDNMFIDLGNIKISTKPICSKYKTTGLVEGFYTKNEIKDILVENKIDIDLAVLDDNSSNVVVWSSKRHRARANIVAYIDINGSIIESKITIRPHKTDVEILDENTSGVAKLKLIEDIKDVFCGSEAYENELNAISESFEAKVRSAIAIEIGDVKILCDEIDYREQNGTKESFIPIGLNEKSPVVLARVVEQNNAIDLSDIEDKVSHLLIYEGQGLVGRIKEKVRRKSDMNYRKHHYDDDSLDPKTVVGRTNLKGSVMPNNGRKEFTEDESESEEESTRS